MNAIYARSQHGEGVTCHFLRASNEYHFINAFKYWFSAKWDGLAPDRENMINRSRLYWDLAHQVVNDALLQPTPQTVQSEGLVQHASDVRVYYPVASG